MGDGGIAHIKLVLKGNMMSFEMLGEFKRARQCNYVMTRINSGEIVNKRQYDKAWAKAQELIK